jgi:peptidoglycan/LPS O-acetylase OafA/YrhL
LKLGRYILGFYKRRLIRIMPALLVMLLATTLATALFIPSAWLSRTIDNTGLSAFFGYSNFNLAWNNENYFSPRVDLNPFLHTWSLAVEEQFYLIFPLIFYFLLKTNGKGKSDNKRTHIEILSYIILIAFAGSSFIFSIFESAEHSKNAFYLLPSRFWELAAGAMLFQLHSKGRLIPKGRGWSNLLIFIGFGAVVAGFFRAEQQAFPFPWALPPVLGTVFLICGTLERNGATSALQKILSSPVLTYIGRISFSLYLWHWPISVLFRWTFGFESIYSKGLYVLLTFLLAMVSYHFIENPIRRSSFLKNQKSWKVVIISLAVIAATYLSARFIVDSKSILSLSVTKDSYIWHSRKYKYEGPKKPITEDPNIVGRNLFAVGDSHTAAYRTMLNIVSKELGIEVHEYEQGGGAVAGLLKPMDDQSKAHYKDVLSEIRELVRPGDVVFLASLRMPEFADQFEPVNIDTVVEEFFDETAVQNRKQALGEAHTIIEDFTNIGAYVVMEAPLPVLFAPPYRCSDWFNKMNPIGANGLSVSRDFLEKIRRPVMESISALTDSHENLYVWDPFPVLCTSETFSAYDGKGEPIFWDGDHLSGNGNRILAPSFREFLVSLWGK